MKLRTKIVTVFAIALGVTGTLTFFGLTGVLDNLSTHMLKIQAENSALFLQHTIIEANQTPGDINSSGVEKKLKIFKHVSDQAQSYEVSKVLLIDSGFLVRAAYPNDEIGANYGGHQDIRDAFAKKNSATVLETNLDPRGIKTTYIDVVSYFTMQDGSSWVLEVKLDFAKTTDLLEKQYASIEFNGVAMAGVLLIILMALLLFLISRTAVKPVLRITSAMESVGQGNLDVVLVFP